MSKVNATVKKGKLPSLPHFRVYTSTIHFTISEVNFYNIYSVKNPIELNFYINIYINKKTHLASKCTYKTILDIQICNVYNSNRTNHPTVHGNSCNSLWHDKTLEITHMRPNSLKYDWSGIINIKKHNRSYLFQVGGAISTIWGW